MGTSASPRGLLEELGELALQHPLLETKPSLEALAAVRPARAPRAVFLGVGMCSRRGLSVTLPVDVLGLLSPAEEVRRALAAERLVLLVADAHAVSAGHSARRVARRAAEVVATLRRAGAALGLDRLEIWRASTLHAQASWRSALALVRRRAPASAEPYFLQQSADVEAMHRRFGSVVKVGWSLGGRRAAADARDEEAFDRFFRDHVGDHVGFVYAKAGRVLDDRRRKAPPYVATDEDRRVCLSPDEDVAAKLAAARASQTRATVEGARRYYRALCSSSSRLGAPLSGAVEERLQTLIRRVFHER